MQNEFISDVASFTTDVQTYLLQGLFFAGGETRNISTQLVLQQCCKKSGTFFVARFTVLINLLPLPSPFNIAQFRFIIFFKVNYNYINESFPFSPGYIYIVSLPWRKESNTWNFVQ